MMKKRLFVLLLCALAALCMTTAYGADASRSYCFTLDINGEAVHRAAPGDVLTVSFTLQRTDAHESAPMYAMQNEIGYDSAFFTLVDGSVLTDAAIRTTTVSGADGMDYLYMNFLSTTGGEPWPADKLVGTFRLRVTGEEGTGHILSRNYIVSTADGRDGYTATARDVEVTLGDEPLPETAVPAAHRPPVGLWLTVAAGAALFALYSRVKLRRR